MLKLDPTAQNLERENVQGGGTKQLSQIINTYSQRNLELANEPQITRNYAEEEHSELEDETYVDKYYGKVYGKDQRKAIENDIHQYTGVKIELPKLSPTASR